MSIVKKIPMLVFSYVHDHGMDKDSLSAEDFVLAQDIETRMTSVFHINNKKVNGKDTSFKFSDVKQMELLRDRIDYLCVCKPLIGRDKAKSWVYSMSRDIEKEKKKFQLIKFLTSSRKIPVSLLILLKKNVSR
ncbi:hypothetical protein NI385_29925 (plasmid) [Vibrio parahaemolyticus]|nr:hypothetical protein NI385_29925 [Vibrio parahaemolyticus]